MLRSRTSLNMCHRTLFSLLTLLLCGTGLAQTPAHEAYEGYSRLLAPEKLYLHTDREVYNMGDTIWFRGYLKNVSSLAEYPECNFLYVELFSAMWERNYYLRRSEESWKMRQRVKVKRGPDGRFCGYLPLSEDLNSGRATLRAYSYWMLNRDPDFMYYKDIEIRNTLKDSFLEDLKTLKVDDQMTYDELGVENPFRTTLFMRSKKKAETDVDLQFLPESGRYTAGQPSVLAIKAVNQDGKGVPVSGSISADGTPIASFSTNDLGMGRCTITVPPGIKHLSAMAETRIETFQFETSLPLPESRAVVINLVPAADSISICVSCFGLTLPDAARLVISDKSIITQSFPLRDSVTEFTLPTHEFKPGILTASIIDTDGSVYAERPFFVFPHQTLVADFEFDKPRYGKRDKVGVTISIHDENGNPSDGDFSLSVTDEDFAPASGQDHSIVSYFLLGSELKGLVENPRYYFDPSVPLDERVRDIDMLLLTQGWRYYDLPAIFQQKTAAPIYGKEFTQSLSGYVNAPIGKARKSTVCFVAPKINFTYIADIDSTAYFILDNLDFPDSTQFLVGAQGRRKLFQKWYSPILDPEYFAAPYTYPDYLRLTGYSKEYGDFASQSYSATDGSVTYTLAPARITAQKSNLSPFPNDEFRKDQYRDEKRLAPYRDYDLFSYILETCPGIKLGKTGALVGKTVRSATRMDMIEMEQPINVFIDGMRSNQGRLTDLMVTDIDAFVYISGVAAAKYDNGLNSPLFAQRGNVPVVLISTKYPIRVATNVTSGKPLGWQQPARFYAPKYESQTERNRFEPMRSTLHWDPSIQVRDGKAIFSFYTSDHQVPYRFSLEGFTSDGTPFSVTFVRDP